MTYNEHKTKHNAGECRRRIQGRKTSKRGDLILG
jgi:hypothetical protein